MTTFFGDLVSSKRSCADAGKARIRGALAPGDALPGRSRQEMHS